MRQFRQAWDLPARPRPIIVIGAGAIVRTAHLPAYKRIGLPVAGVFDVRAETAEGTAGQFGIPKVFDTLGSASAAGADLGAIFDLAVPGSQVLPVLQELPEGAGVLIQKPMGETLDDARAILRKCR